MSRRRAAEQEISLIAPPVRRRAHRVKPPKGLIIIAMCSGGRSSAMAIEQMIAEGRPPDMIHFCNTGLESVRTYEFIIAFYERVIKPAGIPFHVLEFTADFDEDGKDTNRRAEVRDVRTMYQLETAGDGGWNSPFFKFIRAFKAIPDQSRRVCTRELKMGMSEQFMKARGHEEWGIAIGFRMGEERRIANFRTRAGETYVTFPLAEAGIDRMAVLAHWQRRGPEIGLPFDAGDAKILLSNCEGCFFGDLGEKVRVARERPGLAKLWGDMEQWVLDHLRGKFKDDQHWRTKPAGRMAIQRAWTLKYLNREPRPAPDPESCAKFFNMTYGWPMVDEYKDLLDAGGCLGFTPPAPGGEPRPGGCESGGCYTDI